MTYCVWAFAIIAITIGLLGTILPVLPGPPLIFVGAFLIAWWHDYSIIGVSSVVILGLLAVFCIVIDLMASTIGARRVGASSLALVGAAVGSILGIFFALPGILVGPFVGAFIGELIAQGGLLRPLLTKTSLHQATKVGIGTWLGILVGTVAKLAIAFSMVGLVLVTLLF